MSLSVGDVEILSFFGCVVLFEACERLWPAREIDRWRDLKLDVLSFVFALVVNRVCNILFREWAPGLGWISPPAAMARLQALPGLLKILLALFLVDLVIYWIHRGQHRFDFLWRTHAWHHSIEQMYWFSGFRTSFFHSFIYNIPQVVIPITFLRLSPAQAAIGYSLGLLIQFWEHTNLDVKIGPLKYLIITPAYHRIHHSATQHRGMNLGTTFSIWDRFFGTYVDPERVREKYALGLGEPIEGKKLPRMLVGI
ncbi:MAG TPA: sterol desaturase family protein [Verrucomicrobiae bacterium]|nr:sterol desaturase family protein [Verrucomicrobiae bacterium]